MTVSLHGRSEVAYLDLTSLTADDNHDKLYHSEWETPRT
jgi:hypothetical protein